MAGNDLTVVEKPVVDTLKFLQDDNSPIITNDEDEDKLERTKPEDEDEDSTDKLKLTDTEDDEEIKVEDDLDFRPSPSKKEILAKFPELFKTFPQIERSIYRDRQYSEMFPSIEDAKKVIERAAILDNTEASIAKGDIEPILESIKSEDKESFLRVVDNFLPALDKIDRGTYLQLLGNIGKSFIKNMLDESNRFDGESDQHKLLSQSATVLHQFLFGNSKWEDIKPLAKPLTEAETKANSREQELIKQRFTEVQADLSERATNAVKATIITYIDPKESMSEYVKTKAIDDCANQLTTQIESDKPFLAKMDSLWKAAFETNFSKPSLEKIKNTYFAKAQVLLPEIIKAIRAKALAGMGKSSPKRVVTEKEDNPRADGKGNGRSASNKSGSNEEPRRRESTKDYLNRTLGD